MTQSKVVVSDTDLRVVSGAQIARLTAGVPRELPLALAEAAIALGATDGAQPDEEATPKKRKRGRNKSTIISDAVQAIANLSEEDFAADGSPRLAALKESVPDITAELRDKAWEQVVAAARETD